MRNKEVISLFGRKNYTDLFTGIRVLNRGENIFIDCYSYEIILKVIKQSNTDLNIFEKTILKLLDYNKSYTSQELSEKIALKKDLINFIIARLRELGLIDNKNSITNIGQKYLLGYTNKEHEHETKRMRIFVNKHTNELLPYIHDVDNEQDDMNIKAIYKDKIKISIGSTGNDSVIEGSYLENKYGNPPDLSQNEISRLINRFNKVVDSDGRFTKIKYDDKYHIEVSYDKDVLFHFKSVVQHGNIDYVIFSDGFVMNVDSVNSFIKTEYSYIINKIRESANKDEDKGEDGINHSDKEISNRKDRYKEINKRLSFLQEQKSFDDNEEQLSKTIDESKEIKQDNKNNILNCYYALIWAFHYYYKENCLSQKQLDLILSNDKAENEEQLRSFLETMKIDLASYSFDRIDKSKINYYLTSNDSNKDPSLDIVLSLCILEASENNNSKMKSLINKYYWLFDFLNKLKHDSRIIRHTNKEENLKLDIREVKKKTLYIIKELLVDFRESTDKIIYAEDSSQKMLNAKNSLARELGYIYFNTLEESIKDELCKISSDKLNAQLPQPYEYIMVLSKSVEMILLDIIEEMHIKYDIDKDELINKIEFDLKVKLPKSLKTVRDKYIKRALKKQNATMGAYTLVILGFMDDDIRQKLCENSFIDTMSNITELRGHGNKVALSIDIDELKELKTKTFNILKILGGYDGQYIIRQ